MGSKVKVVRPVLAIANRRFGGSLALFSSRPQSVG
jgi:hypothetical protein